MPLLLFIESADDLFTVEESLTWEAKWLVVERLLDSLDPQTYPYLIVAKQQLVGGDYIQCTGGQKRLSVEFRQYIGNTFKHFVLGIGDLNGQQTNIVQKFSEYTIDTSQLLIIEDAKKLFHDFLAEGKIRDGYIATDITSDFQSFVEDGQTFYPAE